MPACLRTRAGSRRLTVLVAALLLAGCSLTTPPPAPTRTLGPVPTGALLPTEQAAPATQEPGPEPAASPTPPLRTVELPEQAATLEGDLEALGALLNTWGSAEAVDMLELERLLRSWRGQDTPLMADGTLSLRSDLDGDGREEIVMALQERAERPESARRALLAVFREVGGAGLKPSVRISQGPHNQLKLLAAADINGDGAVELAVVSSACGSGTCHVRPEILRWAPDQFADLLTLSAPYGLPEARVALRDLDGDGAQELVLDVAPVVSGSGGLQRPRTEIYAWDGAQYTLQRVTYDQAASQHPYFLMLDGNAALDAGEVDRAAGLYEQAISAPYPGPETSAPAAIDAFARFRLLLTALLLDDEQRAESIYRAARDLDGEHGAWAAAFWASYAAGGELQPACEAAIVAAMGRVELFEPLNLLGAGSPAFGPQDLCPKGMR